MMFGQTAPGVSALGVARGAAVEVFEVLDRVPPIDSSSREGLKPDKVDGHVVFDSVGFSYVSGVVFCSKIDAVRSGNVWCAPETGICGPFSSVWCSHVRLRVDPTTLSLMPM